MRELALEEVAEPGAWADVLADRLVAARLLLEYGDPREARQRAGEVAGRLLPGSRLLVVTSKGAAVGHVWFARDDDTADVIDLTMTEPLLGAPLCAAVVELASAEGAAELRVGVVRGEAAQESFVGGGRFELMATNLRLDLSGDPVEKPAPVRLDEMSDDEFTAFMAGQTASYALEREQAGEAPERATRTAREQLAELVPDGKRSADQHFLAARTRAGTVGHLWLDTARPTAYVYDVIVAPQHRGCGHGRSIMESAAHWAKGRGAIALGLNVFAHNVVARGLYDALGYVATEDHYRRALDTP